METPKAAKEQMRLLLEAIASGTIEVSGIRKGDLPGLHQKVLDLAGGVQDGTLKRGDTIPFADKGKGVVVGVGDYGGRTIYQIQLIT